MYAVFCFQIPVGVWAQYLERGGFYACPFPFLIIIRIDLEPFSFRPSHVHPVEHFCPVLGFGAASACMYGDQGVTGIILA